MVCQSLNQQTQAGHRRAPTLVFRLLYYAICLVVAAALVGLLRLASPMGL